MLTRRNFNHIFLSAIGISIYPTILFANKYSGPINWVGNSFIAKASDIERLIQKVRKTVRKKLERN